MIVRAVNGSTIEKWEIDRHMGILAVMTGDGFRWFDVQVTDLIGSDTIEPFIVTCSIITEAEIAPYYTIPCTSRTHAERLARIIVARRGKIPPHISALSYYPVGK